MIAIYLYIIVYIDSFLHGIEIQNLNTNFTVCFMEYYITYKYKNFFL